MKKPLLISLSNNLGIAPNSPLRVEKLLLWIREKCQRVGWAALWAL